MKRWPALFILFLIPALLPAFSQHIRNEGLSPAEHFDAVIQAALPQWKTPGLAVVVVKDGKVLFNKGYGVADIITGAPFTTSTLSVCASTTKAMTAACMGMLVDEGMLSWSDKVSDVYPPFKLYDAYASSETTIKDLFTHNAGLGNADWLWVFDYPTDTIIRRLRYQEPAYSFRSSFIYQNIMYIVAGEVIRQVSGTSWEEFISERLFKPLGMQHTYTGYSRLVKEEPRITPHFMFEDSSINAIPFMESKAVGSAGGVWSCTNDMAKWLAFMIDSGRVKGKPLLTPETWGMILQPQVIVPESEFYPTRLLTKPAFMTYGLGWFQHDYRGELLQFHTGSLDGAVAITGILPGKGFGVYVFGNLDHTEIRHALLYKAIDLFVFNDNSRDWPGLCYKLYASIGEQEKRTRHVVESQLLTGASSSLSTQAYSGTFSHPVYGLAKVKKEGADLVMEFPNGVGGTLRHWNYDTFFLLFKQNWWGKMPVHFNQDWQGTIVSFAFDGHTFTRVRE